MDMGQKKFEPFDKILLKNKKEGFKWWCDWFSHEDKDNIYTVGFGEYPKDIFDIIPFEGNETLVGTSDMTDDSFDLKDGERIVVFYDEREFINKGICNIRYYRGIKGDVIYSSCNENGNISSYKFCIPLSKFNPDDMAETRKHILTVKNGKLVKAIV